MESIKIEGVEQHQGIYVDTIGENVWVNIIVRNGSANLCITPENADKLIEAIYRHRLAIGQVAYEG
jgi:hypothetical protein